MTNWWHVVKSTRRFGPDRVQTVWSEERSHGIVSAGYGNAPDGPGHDKLRRYRHGDRIFAYVPAYGAVGVGEVIGAAPDYRPVVSPEDHAHFLSVTWLAAVEALADAVPPAAIRTAGGYPPRTLAMRLPADVATRIEALLRAATISLGR